MVRWSRYAFVGVVGLAMVVGLAALGSTLQAAPGGNRPDRSTKTAQIACRPGWRGSAGGVYGGVGFSVSCNNGKGQTHLTGVTGTAYSVRMGVDCFFTGDAANVRESCAEVTLTIR